MEFNIYFADPTTYLMIDEFVLNKDNTIFWPENRMTLHDILHSSRPAEYHVITNEPRLISLYKKSNVFKLVDRKLESPKFETYGASFDMILNWIGYEYTIPAAVIDSKLVTNCMGYKVSKTIQGK